MSSIWHTVNISPDVTADVRVTKRDGRYWVTGVNTTGSALTADALRRLPLARIELMANAGADVGDFMADTKRPKLKRPDRTDPDGFYQRVADAYRDVIRSTSRVTDALAVEAGVPTGTSRRWILEARRRGFLLPSKRYPRAKRFAP